jgi:hypothetical protein
MTVTGSRGHFGVRQITEVISTKRSAHHAFIRWFCQNARHPVAFFNNVIPSSPPRLRELERYTGGVPQVASKATDHVNELLEGETDVLMNFEGKIPSSVERWNDKYLRSHVNGRLVRVVFLRDPVNTLASLAKRCRPKDFRSLFKYFYQVLALEQIIAQLAQKKSSFCEKVVLMSPWLRDEHYRAEVAQYFNLTPGLPPAEVTRQGGGSSFNGMAYDPATNHAALNERWRVVEENPLFLTPFADPQTAEAARQYFRMYGAHESVDPAMIDSLEARAAKSPEAADYLKRVLEPMRKARASLDAMEYAPQPAIRELWKGVITTRMMLRI